MTSAPRAWERIIDAHAGQNRVTTGTGFGSNPGLRVDGKIFAMLNDGRLVVKLPKDRVDRLVADAIAERFEPGTGRVMKEWAVVPAEFSRRWPKLVVEARAFVDPARR
jgi:hypothetical protein